MLTATLFIDCRCTLGEGIVWWRDRRALLWADIEGRRLWMHDERGTRHWDMPDRLGSLAPCASGRLLLALAKGLFLADLDAASDQRLPLTRVAGIEPDLSSTRANDGRTDRLGNFVFGTMDMRDGHPRTGSFYQWSARYGLRRLDLPHAGIPNSICFSPDGATMYFCDSPQGRIMRCRYDAASARVTDIATFVVVDGGSPDGSVIDAEGFLWNAGWGAHAVRRFAPDGTLDREIRIPVPNPTCPVFGGESMDTVFVTTARQEMSDEDLMRTPEAGGIYHAVVSGVHGIPDGPVTGA
jgi:sugar lactone lactonase YvrE